MTSAGRLATAGSVAALALLAALWPGDALRDAAVATADGPPDAAAPAPAESAPAGDAPAPESTIATPATGTRAPAGPDLPWREGRVVVVDTDRVEHANESGTLVLLPWIGNATEPVEVAVEAGRFRWRSAATGRVGARDGVLGGRAVTATPGFHRGPGVVDLRVTWTVESTIRVVDARTGEDLRDVECVLSPFRYGYLAGRGPMPNGIRVEGDSPLAYSAGGTADRSGWAVHATAPGYAQALGALPLWPGGEALVALEPGGALEVELTGAEAVELAWVYVRRGDALLASGEASASPARFEALPADTYDVTVERHQRVPPGRFVQGATRAVVPAGGVGRALVVLDPAPAPTLVELAGVVVVPEAWGRAARTLRVLPRDPSPTARDGRDTIGLHTFPEPGSVDAFAFEADPVEPGRYRLRLDAPPCAVDVVVPEHGLRDARLEVPPPGELLVRTVDARTGERVEVPELRWTPVAGGAPTGGGASAPFVEAQGGHLVRTPVGRVRLSLERENEWLSPDEDVEVRPGTRDVELRLRPVQSVRVVVRANGERIPLPGGVSAWFEAAVRAVDHFGESRGPTVPSSAEWGTFILTRPGRYALSLPDHAGFRPVRDLEFEVAEGERATLDVALEPLW